MQFSKQDFSETSSPIFTLAFQFNTQDFSTEWKRLNLLANYVAEYLSYQFARREKAENLLSTITNEVLEAIIHLSPSDAVFSMNFLQFPWGIRLDIDHTVSENLLVDYQTFIAKITQSSGEDMYHNLMIEEVRPSDYFNQLGLLMLVHDFDTGLAAQPGSTAHQICTQITIPTEEFAE